MDIRKYHPSDEQIARLRKLVNYQPYVFSDEYQAGIADCWVNEGELYSISRSEVTPAQWKQFDEANGAMRQMYSDWIDAICQQAGDISKMTVVDTAANAGHFLYRFLEKGVNRAVGYELDANLEQVFEVMNEVTGFNAEFNGTPYDMMKHEIPNAEKGDIVISSAIMCHLSDPLYYLNFLGSITKKILFIFTGVENTPAMRITYNPPRLWYPEYPFPICFDNMTTISEPLLRLGFEELGFSKVIELEHQPTWLAHHWYHPFKAFIAIR